MVLRESLETTQQHIRECGVTVTCCCGSAVQEFLEDSWLIFYVMAGDQSERNSHSKVDPGLPHMVGTFGSC
jgi:hypothetical protein